MVSVLMGQGCRNTQAPEPEVENRVDPKVAGQQHSLGPMGCSRYPGEARYPKEKHLWDTPGVTRGSDESFCITSEKALPQFGSTANAFLRGHLQGRCTRSHTRGQL